MRLWASGTSTPEAFGAKYLGAKNSLLFQLISGFLAVLHGTRIWMTDGGEFLEDEEAAEFHLLKLVTAAKGRSD